jgi:hypothetical protein
MARIKNPAGLPGAEEFVFGVGENERFYFF